MANQRFEGAGLVLLKGWCNREHEALIQFNVRSQTNAARKQNGVRLWGTPLFWPRLRFGLVL
jgi:hypothetical protein